jgi:hypothetical protein
MEADMVRIRFFLLGALCFVFGSVALQAQQFTISNQQLVSSVRASLYQYDYTYQITAMNTGPDVANVTCVVTSTTPQTIIESGSLTFGDMSSGSSAISTTTLVLRQDRRYAFSWSNLQWQWSSAALLVGLPVIYPVSLFVGDTTLVTVTSQITSGTTGPPLVAGGATLLQVDQNNQVIATLGTMNDTGMYGDASPGDQTYTTQFTTSPTAAGQMYLRVSAQFQGMPTATLSGVATLPIGPQPATTQTVGSDGGTFNFPHGVVLEIPSGAVSAPTVLRVADVPADQANTILASGNNGSDSKRFLGGFSPQADIQFSVPIMATFPVQPLQFREIPLAAEIDLVGQGYTLTPNQLTFNGNHGTATIQLSHFSSPVVLGGLSNPPVACLAGEDPTVCANRFETWGCLPGEDPATCNQRYIECTACSEFLTPNMQCSSFQDAIQPACCIVDNWSSSSCGVLPCSCCKEKTVTVQVSSSDISSGSASVCQIAGEQVQLTYLDCPNAPTEDASLSGELSDGCPVDLKVKVNTTPATPSVFACAPPIPVTGAITGTSASTGKTIPFDASVLEWSELGPIVLQATGPSPSGAVVGASVNLHATESEDPGGFIATLTGTNYSTTVPVQISKATATVTPTQETLLGPEGQFTPVASIDHNVCSPCLMTWSSDTPSVATVDPNSGLVTAVNGGSANISGVLNPKAPNAPPNYQDCLEPYSVSVPLTVCSLAGTWQGTFLGQRISCAQRDSNGCCIQRGGLNVKSGSVSATFVQSGMNVSTSIQGELLTGTDVNGTVSVETTVPGYCGTVEVPAVVSGSISSDCSTFTGSFYVAKGRPKTGTFVVTKGGTPLPPGPPVAIGVIPSTLITPNPYYGGSMTGTVTITGQNLQNATISTPYDGSLTFLGSPTVSGDGTSVSQQYSIGVDYFPLIFLLVQTPLGTAYVYAALLQD